MGSKYPYADPGKDGFHIELVEYDKWKENSHLRHAVPLDEHRYGIQVGELVQLIFAYKTPHFVGETKFRAEHMWVQYLGNGERCMVGRLDNDPEHTDILEAGDIISFHPLHIIKIWGYDPDCGIIHGTRPIPPKDQENKSW